MMKKTLIGLSIVLLWTTLSFAAEKTVKPELLQIIDKSTEFTVNTPKGPIVITRVMTDCAKNKGWLQPLVPIAGIHPVTEIDILHALNDKDSVVVDMRQPKYLKEGTIPGSINIPFTDISERMEELGCKRKEDYSYDCHAAKKVYGFCNGPVCPQSPMGMKDMVDYGFPVDKLYYYRGGMLDWSALGLTMVRVDQEK